MKKLHLEKVINAPRQKVWENIVNDEPYREWVGAISPGVSSHFEGSWEEGAQIKFVGTNEEGKLEGMSSEIAENRPNEFVSIRHVGVIMNGIEDRESEQAKKWTPAYENYTLSEEDGKTTFTLDLDIDEEFEDMFREMWEKGLEKLKEISERE